MNYRRTIKKALLLLGDATLFYTALFAILLLRYYATEDALIIEHVIPFTILFVLWLITFGAFELYDLKVMINGKKFLYRLLKAMIVNGVIAVLILYLIPFWEIEPRRNLFAILGLATSLIFLWRYVFNLVIIRTQSYRIIFFGITKEVIDLAQLLIENPQLGHKPIALVSNDSNNSPLPISLPHYPQEELVRIAKEKNADTIIISSEIKENKDLVKMLFQIIPLGVSVVEFPHFYEMLTGKIPLSLIDALWFIENLIGTKMPMYEFSRRALDICMALLFLIPSFILFPFVAFAIKLDSEGEVIYSQKRVGRHGRLFRILKYRSMIKNADALSGLKGNGQDPRHTRLGTILRKLYIDELPQIINIFRGEMSFVGPRPERPEYVETLKQKIPFYEMRLLVPPGITGWAQINMENDASVEDAPEKMQYDLYYIKNRSIILDLLIILRTILIVLRRTGR